MIWNNYYSRFKYYWSSITFVNPLEIIIGVILAWYFANTSNITTILADVGNVHLSLSSQYYANIQTMLRPWSGNINIYLKTKQLENTTNLLKCNCIVIETRIFGLLNMGIHSHCGIRRFVFFNINRLYVYYQGLRYMAIGIKVS